MTPPRRLLPALTAVLTGAATVLLGVSSAVASVPEPPDEEGPAAPGDSSYLQKTMPGQTLPPHAYAIAAQAAQRLPASGGAWKAIGPTNIGGRITSLALDPRRPDTVYAAAASGGLWVSRDAGQRFEPAWPADLTQAMGAVATGPDGTVYAGTGEVNPGGGSITYQGTGLYASHDGGRHWRLLGLADSGTIGAITIDPTNPKRIFVAAAGSLFNPGGERGVYRSINGGATWQRVLAGSTAFTGATEVLLDPANHNRLYAVLWDHRREPDLRTYGGVGSGVYRSTDGGATWRLLTGGLPGAAASVGRIGLGQAPSQPDRLYAIVNQTSGPFQGFYGSTDGGDTWTRLPDDPDLTGSQSSFGWWFGKVWVDPVQPLHVHLAGVPLMTTKDGGQTWLAEETAIHADQHAMVWDPRHPGRVYLGDDGGTYRSDASGDGGWTKAVVEPYTQFYSAAITPQDITRVSGGAQDNGSLRSWNGPAFNEYVGGDGEENQINPLNKDNVYACYQYGNCFWSIDGGDTVNYFGDKVVADRSNWFTPLVFDPRDPTVMYYGANILNRSTDGGRTWTAISGDLTGGPGRDPVYTNYGTITSVAPAGDGRTVYTGTDDGRVWVTHDLGATWKMLLSGQPWVSRVVVDPRSADRVYVTLSAYRAGSNQPYLLGSTDGGQHFTDLTGNLPQAPVNDVVIVSRGATLYAATDQGVFVSATGGRAWSRLGHGMPLVPIDDIEYDGTHHRLVAATFGRGLYEIKVP
jgi:photosystem II stability/assembly factor-like uncharacterized protein